MINWPKSIIHRWNSRQEEINRTRASRNTTLQPPYKGKRVDSASVYDADFAS